MGAKLGSSLPDDPDSGLYMLQAHLVKRPEDRHVIIAVVDCGAQTTKFVGPGLREVTPTARVLFVEPLLNPEDVNDAVTMLGRARSTRLNRDELDFEEFGVGDPFESLARQVIDDMRDFADEEQTTKPEDTTTEDETDD